MIKAARRARRPDRQSRDARFAQAMRAPPACNIRRSELVHSGRVADRDSDARTRTTSKSAGAYGRFATLNSCGSCCRRRCCCGRGPASAYRVSCQAAATQPEGLRRRATAAFSLNVGWLSRPPLVVGVGGILPAGEVGSFLFRRSGRRRVFVGAVSASQFHAGPSGGQKARGLAEAGVGPARRGGLKGCWRERTCQAAIRILRATAALAGFLPARAARSV